MFLPIKSPLVDLQHQHPSEIAGNVLLGSTLPLDPSQLYALDPSIAVFAGMPFPFAVCEPLTPTPICHSPWTCKSYDIQELSTARCATSTHLVRLSQQSTFTLLRSILRLTPATIWGTYHTMWRGKCQDSKLWFCKGAYPRMCAKHSATNYLWLWLCEILRYIFLYTLNLINKWTQGNLKSQKNWCKFCFLCHPQYFTN